MAFLDNDGVKALWEKVKKYVDNHAGGSASQWVGTSYGGSTYIGACLGSGKELCSITLPEAGTYLVRGFVTFGGAGTANSLLYQVYIDETTSGCYLSLCRGECFRDASR